MFSDVVMGIDKNNLKILMILKEQNDNTGCGAYRELKEVVSRYKELYRQKMGDEFPQDPKAQLLEAVKRYLLWNNPRAIVYRRERYSGDWGTAVNVQAMVFGNMGDDMGQEWHYQSGKRRKRSCMGNSVIQGEDVVAGIRHRAIEDMREIMPEIYDQFISIAQKLENHYRDMQDMEFTIERSNLHATNPQRQKNCGSSFEDSGGYGE